MPHLAARPLFFSALLHAAVFGALMVLMLRVSRAPSPASFVVEWVSAPTVSNSRENPATPAAASVNFTPVRVVVPVADAVPVAEVAAPRSRAVANPAASAQPVATRITITEHRRRNSAPSPSADSSSSRPGSAHHARINMDDVLAGAPPSLEPPATGNETVPRSASYWETLLGKLRAAHEKSGDLADGLQARVEFALLADGSIGDVRILRSSGNAGFDASVLEAFRRVRDLGPPPEGLAGVNRLNFRVRAE